MLWLVLCFLLFALFYFRYRIRAILSFYKEEIFFVQPRYKEPLKKIVDCLGEDNKESVHEKINGIRNWINVNSIHLIDEEHDSYAFHLPTVIKMLCDYWERNEVRPHLSCGPRAYAMKKILGQMGFKSRVIDLFVIRPQEVADSHTLLEVYNSETGCWELQDPDFNVVYVDRETGVPLSAVEALKEPGRIAYDAGKGTIENLSNLEGTIEKFFYIGVLYRYSYEGFQSLFVVGPEFLPDSTFVFFKNQKINFQNYLNKRDPVPKICNVQEFWDKEGLA